MVLGRGLLSAAALIGSCGLHGLVGASLVVLQEALSAPPAVSSRLGAPSGELAEAELRRPLPPAPDPKALAHEVRAGRLWLGEALVTRAELDTAGAQRALTAYRDLVEELRFLLPRALADVPRVVVRLLREHGLDDYKSLNHDLASALLHRGGDCRGRTELIVALLYDSGLRDRVLVRVFSNHLAPVFHDGRREHRFGMVADCSGLGEPVEALALVEDHWPSSRDACRPSQPIVGAGLRDDDPPPSWSGKQLATDELCPLADWPWRLAGSEVYLTRTGTEPARDWVPLVLLQPTDPQLQEHAAGLECHAQSLAALRIREKGMARTLAALGRAVAYGEETALLLAAAGELEGARWVEGKVRAHLQEAKALLEHWDHPTTALRAELGSLIHLGPPGQAALLRLAQEHICWSGSDMLAILVREPATRERALELYRTRSRPQQIETADRMYWTDGAFQSAMEPHPVGRQALRLRAAVSAVRERWKSCSFTDLRGIAASTAREFALDREWAAPLVAVLAEDARVHLRDQHCRVDAFTDQVRSWGQGQPSEIRVWLDRQTQDG
ncbi:hypothetical protein ACFL5O_00725 [Myxococcota bacterium]